MEQKLEDVQESNDMNLVKEGENSIVFTVDKNNELILRISVQNTEKNSADKLAQVMYYLNKGMYQISLIDMLIKISKEDSSRAYFIENVINGWAKYLDTQDSTDYYKNGKAKPVISPSKFSQMVMQQGKAYE
jgi:hypothetical protein